MFGVERVMRSTRSCPYQKFERYPFYYSTTLHAETQLEIFRSPVAQRRISTFRRYYVNIDYLNRAKHELGARGAEKRVITFSRTGRSEKLQFIGFNASSCYEKCVPSFPDSWQFYRIRIVRNTYRRNRIVH